ncbi:MAG: DUF805 domain-containing protein [Acidimicrobiia bacterium]|nr:DUF805 domain-containing protein [Acidimicrobiia bacterium]
MSFVDAIKSGFRNYAKFRGRAGRSEYWWFFLFTVLAQTVASSISDDFGNLVGLAVFLPGLAVQVRRFHDTGRSGWWVGAFYGSIGVVIVSVVVLIVDAALDFDDFANGTFASDDFFGDNVSAGSVAFVGIATLAALALLVINFVFLCQRSKTNENRFGPPPPPKVL